MSDCSVCALVKRGLDESPPHAFGDIVLSKTIYERALVGIVILYSRYPSVFRESLCERCAAVWFELSGVGSGIDREAYSPPRLTNLNDLAERLIKALSEATEELKRHRR